MVSIDDKCTLKSYDHFTNKYDLPLTITSDCKVKSGGAQSKDERVVYSSFSGRVTQEETTDFSQ